MNKLMMTAAAAVLASVAFGAETTKPTLEQVKARYQEVLNIATTNLVKAQRISDSEVMSPLIYSLKGTDVDAFRKTVDDTLSAIGIEYDGSWYTKKDFWAAKMCKIQFDRREFESNSPYAVSLGRKYGRVCSAKKLSRKAGLTADELIGLLNENLDLIDGCVRVCYSTASFTRICKKFQEVSVKYVKKYLRRQGKSFVTKDGVNPCEDLMKELNTALNAPYFNGLNEWNAKVGINASVDISKLPTSAEVQALKNAILNADKNMTNTDKMILKICLGVDGYNAFVKEYNGEN